MEINEFTPGRFCWSELATSDDKAATKFYSDFFDWKSETHSMGGGHGDYTMLQLNGKDVGGLYELMPEQRSQGVPPHWLSYVGVEDVDAATEKARSLGGTCVLDPLDIMDKGRMSVIQDPTGSVFAMWQAKASNGCGVVGEPGATCWNELMTSDTKKAGDFYSQLFGWEKHEQDMGGMQYTMFMQGEVPVAGMMTLPPEAGEAPPHWMLYFSVGDCDENVERATKMGAQVCAPPMDIPTVGRMAVLMDPQGAAFSIIKLDQQPC